MRSTMLAAVAGAVILAANLARAVPGPAGCGRQRDSALLSSPARRLVAQPPRGIGRLVRETVGHASIPALVTFAPPAADRSLEHWAALVPDGGEWTAGETAAGAVVQEVRRPLFAFGVQPAGALPGIRFPAGAAGDLHRARLGFAWPESIDAADFTLSTWIRPAEFRRGEHLVVASRSDAAFYQANSGRAGWHLYLSDGGDGPALAYAEEGDGRTVSSMASQARIAAGPWTHLALTLSRSTSTIALYVNGTLQGRLPRPAGTAALPDLAIGTFAGSAGSSPLRGDLVWTTLTSPPLPDDAIARLAADRRFAACGSRN